MTALELRLACWAFLAIALSGWLTYERFHLIGEGEKRCEKADQTAALEQAGRDHKADQEAIDGLQTRIRELEGGAPPTQGSPPPAGASAPPELRVRIPAGSSSGRPATAGTQPRALSDRGCDQRVPGGAEGEATVDLGPVVQDLALAGLLNRADSEGLWERAVKQAQPSR